MRSSILILVFLYISPAFATTPEMRSTPDEGPSFFEQKDKQKHIAVSALLTTVGFSVGQQAGLTKKQSILASAITVMSIGLAKEILDDNFDTDDILANAVGTGVGATLLTPVIVMDF